MSSDGNYSPASDLDGLKDVIKSLNTPRNENLPESNSTASPMMVPEDATLNENIAVLYIDSDTNSHLDLIRKVGDRFIQLRSSFSGKEALELLERQKFDIILCEFSLPDMDTFYILEQYATRIPIVIISSSEDADLIMRAEKSGAMGFISKKYSGLKIIISLYTAIDKWKKYDDYSYKKRLINNPHVKEVLQGMMSSPTKQQIKHQMWYDALVNDTETNTKILESLIDAGYASKEQSETTVSCPRCNSIDLTTHYGCPNCGDSSFVRGVVLEHKCGFTDLENKYTRQDDDSLVCPKCNKGLKTLGVDYFKMDSAFRCQNCATVSTTPETRYKCNNCGHQNFKLSEGNWVSLYSYSLKPEMFSEIKQNTISLDPIKEFLSTKGFQFGSDNKFGIVHPEMSSFDLVAQKQGMSIVAVVMGSYVEENFLQLVKLGTLPGPIDTKIIRLAIMFSRPTDITKYLLKKFDIISIVTEDETDMLLKFKEYYANIAKGM